MTMRCFCPLVALTLSVCLASAQSEFPTNVLTPISTNTVIPLAIQGPSGMNPPRRSLPVSVVSRPLQTNATGNIVGVGYNSKAHSYYVYDADYLSNFLSGVTAASYTLVKGVPAIISMTRTNSVVSIDFYTGSFSDFGNFSLCRSDNILGPYVKVGELNRFAGALGTIFDTNPPMQQCFYRVVHE